LYDTSCQWAIDIMGCLKSIGDKCGVEFEAAIGGTDPEQTIQAVQNFGAAGYNGIINLHPGTIMAKLVEICEQYGMYIVTSNDPSSLSADYASFSSNPYFVGEVWEDETRIAKDIVDEMYKAGARNFALHGFPEGLSAQMDTRLIAAREEIQTYSDAKIVTEGLSFDKAGAAEDILAQFGDQVDAIFSSVETVSTVYQPLINAGKSGKIQLNCYDPNKDALAAFKDGTLTFATTGTCADSMIAFVLLYNAMEGHKMMTVDNSVPSINMSYIICRSAEDFETAINYCSADNPPYTFNELEPYMQADSKLDELRAFAEAFSLDDIAVRRGEK
ncbi:MAG: substrate-binding domain-containing protein, partial [Parasporobacterium sp.]|nr:substrate-binding domain-containing protein [Parasporobacterium sp.]